MVRSSRVVRLRGLGASILFGGIAVWMSVACGDGYATDGDDAGSVEDPDGTPADDDSGDILHPGDGGPGAVDGEAGILPTCDRTKRFSGTKEIVNGITTGTPRSPRLLPDELTAFTYGGSGQTLTIVTASRPTKGATFDPPATLTTLSSGDSTTEPMPTVSADGLVIVFSRIDSGVDKLFMATRSAIGAPFGAPTLLPEGINDPGSGQATPFLKPDGKVLYFSRKATGGDRHLMRSEMLQGGATFTTATELTELESAEGDAEWKPAVTADDLTIFWSSTRADLAAKGQTDIYTASRTDVSQPFGTIRNVDELNTSTADDPTWLSPDGCALYYTTIGTGFQIVVVRR